ncbi:MAG: serine palmitoyltransferase component [Chrysothrix sp. TS-e1954]|nr:MAG: serine palmitoyltransferase component [Chrysothrix sp. TS-e1954]
MPRSINPFAAGSSPPRTTALETTDEKSVPRRNSFSKANQRLQQFFTPSPKSKYTDAQALQAATALQQAYLNSSSPTLNPASLSLPTISLSTATGEKFRSDDRTTTLYQPPSSVETRRLARQNAQFAPILSPQHKYASRFVGEEFPDPIEDEPPYYFLLTTYISYLLLIIFGHVRDFFGKRFKQDKYRYLREQNGYAPLNSDFDNFYVRRLKFRINDCFSRPVTGVPGRFITLVDRKSDDHNLTFHFTGTTTETLNMASYNYLGFANSEGLCADTVEATIRRAGITMAAPRGDAGTSDLHLELERLTAEFVGKEDCTIFSMGYGTNASAFPALVGKGSLVISDELNHTSIRTGMRLSGAVVQTFKHNDMRDLERLLREVISQGQPRTHRPWKKILVTVEGLYSMEGTLCNLPALARLRQKYKFFLFVDEAHSIGAIGPSGRGVCDYFGIDPSNVDVLMGTFTKSFGANGGYVCADKTIIDKLRVTNGGTIYGESPTTPVLQQTLTALKLITGELNPGQGDERLQRLAFNSRYLRLGLKRLGFIVYGHDDSPVVPLLLYNTGKIPAFSREMLRRKISVVVVGYPATPLVTSRARFCVSAAHNKDDLDRLLEACDEIGNVLQLKFSSGIAGGAEPLPEGITNPEEIKHRKIEAKGGVPEYKPPRWDIKDVLARGAQDVKVPLR